MGPPGPRNDRAPEASVRGAREIIEPGGSGVPGANAWHGRAIHFKLRKATAYVECGGLPPLSAARACPGVLLAFGYASDRARQASPENSGSKLPHSTWCGATDNPSEWLSFAKHLRRARRGGPLQNLFPLRLTRTPRA